MSCYPQTTQTEYEELCKLDLLGLLDQRDQSQAMVFEEFEEHVRLRAGMTPLYPGKQIIHHLLRTKVAVSRGSTAYTENYSARV